MTQLWVERLGATLLHFIWQGTVIAAAFAVARKCAASRPETRYFLASAALVLMALSPVVTWVALHPAESNEVAASFQAPLSAARPAGVAYVPTAAAMETPRRPRVALLSWVVGIWFTGALLFALRLTGGWMTTRRLRSRGVHAASPEWQRALAALRARISLSKPVCLLVSALVEAPAAVGWLRPVILVPAGTLVGLPAAQVEAILLHELAHIRRNDYLVSVAQGIVESLLFYHPAVWWISRQIRVERELCCDDFAVGVTGDVLSYARALAEFAEAQRLSPVMGANGGPLSYRVARLLGESRPAPRAVSGPAVLAAGVLLGVTGFAVFGQQPVRPQFDAASVKPGASRGFQMVRPLPGRLTASASLRMLIQNAYSLQSFQIAGAPSWVDSDRFEVEAKAAGNASREQIFVMFQSLLEDRFELRVHRERKELPAYALVAAKSGLKLPRPKDGACAEPATDARPDWAGGRMAPPGGGPQPLPACGTVRVRLAASGALMEGGKIRMAELARSLSMAMDRPVVDKTGFADAFDVQLSFVPNQVSAALPPPPPGTPEATDTRLPSIVTALQEQLGLRVESAKAPVEVLVIDHVARPSAN